MKVHDGRLMEKAKRQASWATRLGGAALLLLGAVACTTRHTRESPPTAGTVPKINAAMLGQWLIGSECTVPSEDGRNWRQDWERAAGSCRIRCSGRGGTVVGVDGGACRFDDLDPATRAPLSCHSAHVADGGLLQWNDGSCTWSCMDQDDPRAGSGYLVAGNIVSASLPDGGFCPYAVGPWLGDYPRSRRPDGPRVP